MNSTSSLRLDNAANLNDCAEESSVSAVSWPAIIAGAFAAAAVSLILLFLGSGLGLSMVSPWSYSSSTAVAVTVKTAIWLIVMQWVASGLGGYLTGRLRTKWTGVHTDEVFFRDTAHGFLAWAVATVLTAGLLASAASFAVGGGVHAAATVASGAAAGASQAATRNAGSSTYPNAYYVDNLFRSATPIPNASEQDVRGETARILAYDLKNGTVPDADKAYLAQLVAARTGATPQDASKRVDDTIAQINAAEAKIKQEADAARKAGITFAMFTFISLLIGAFIASVAAAMGGRHRDTLYIYNEKESRNV